MIRLVGFVGFLVLLVGIVCLGVSYLLPGSEEWVLHLESPLPGGDSYGPPIPVEYRIERWEGTFPHRSTLQEVLFQYGFTPQDIHQLVTETREVYNLNKVAAVKRYALERYADGRFRRFEYFVDDEKHLVVDYQDNRYQAELIHRQLTTVVEGICGQITEHLWNTVIAGGESGYLAMGILEIMQWDIDFTEIQPHDSFKLVFEKKYHHDEFVKYGDLLAVEFHHGGKKFHAFLFEDPVSGKKAHYDFNGKLVKKAFLRVPLKADFRISSGFSYSRLHPVSRRRLPHYGVDYAAPRGTRVYASASGRVIFAGWNGGSGRMVKIRHPNGYTTFYLHLSKILVRVGKSVRQGDPIGLVGATGIATGPHLDYRIQRSDGGFVNPRKLVALPSDKGVAPEHMEQFLAARDVFLRQLDSLPVGKPVVKEISVAG